MLLLPFARGCVGDTSNRSCLTGAGEAFDFVRNCMNYLAAVLSSQTANERDPGLCSRSCVLHRRR